MHPCHLHSRVMFCVLASFVLLACHSEPTIGTLVHEDSARPRPRALEEPERDETLVAVDSSGVVRLVDAASLELRLGVRASEEEATVVDLSVHAEEGELRRLAIVSQAEEEAPSDVSVFPFTGDVFARPRVVRRFEGVLDVLALSDGALVFQLGEAREWSFVSAGEDRPRSKQCPMPTSVLAVEHHEGATHVIALARSADDTPILARGVIEEGPGRPLRGHAAVGPAERGGASGPPRRGRPHRRHRGRRAGRGPAWRSPRPRRSACRSGASRR
jgi:hypothetical protein